MSNVKFAYRVPNISGVLVESKLPQNTSWNFEPNKNYAQIAEQIGFEYALLQTRFIASYGAAALRSAITAVTEKINSLQPIIRVLVYVSKRHFKDHDRFGEENVNRLNRSAEKTVSLFTRLNQTYRGPDYPTIERKSLTES